MTSISEEPNLELKRSQEISGRFRDSRDEAGPRVWRDPSRNKSASVYMRPSKDASYDADISTADITPKRKRTASSRALRKIW